MPARGAASSAAHLDMACHGDTLSGFQRQRKDHRTMHSNTIVNPRAALAGALGLAIATASAPALAQATVKVDGKWRAALGAGFTNSSGNLRSSSITVNGDAVRVTEEDKWAINGSALYARSTGAVTGRQARAGTRYDYNLSPRTFVFGGLDFEHDRIAGLTSRGAASTGFGFKFVNTPEHTFNVFGGLNYTRDRYEAPRDVDGQLRTAYNYPSAVLGEESTHKFSPSVSAKQRFAYLPTLVSGGSYRAQFEAGLSVAVMAGMNLNVGFTARHNSDPGPGLRRTDTLLTTGIAVKFD